MLNKTDIGKLNGLIEYAKEAGVAGIDLFVFLFVDNALPGSHQDACA